jgi:hypothetical protein
MFDDAPFLAKVLLIHLNDSRSSQDLSTLHSRKSITSHIKNGCISAEIQNGANLTGKCSYTRYALTHNDE